ncbi:MAG: hypothetical protein OXC57_01225 [Rhodobacteraceae bacterium]|nr:hypothetical protein [Paracoccaceae bacterium]
MTETPPNGGPWAAPTPTDGPAGCHAQRPANIPGVVKDLPAMSFGMNEFNPSKGCVEDTGTSRGHHGYTG